MNTYNPMNDNICTPFELKEFAFSSDPSAWNFARWIESKSGNKYTVIEIELIRDALTAINHYLTNANDVNDELRQKWHEQLKMLKL